MTIEFNGCDVSHSRKNITNDSHTPTNPDVNPLQKRARFQNSACHALQLVSLVRDCQTIPRVWRLIDEISKITGSHFPNIPVCTNSFMETSVSFGVMDLGFEKMSPIVSVCCVSNNLSEEENGVC